MLHTDTLAASGVTPTRWILFLHGILGRGANWRGFARRLIDDVPGLGAILVDLRAHGESRDLSSPDSVASAAADLWPLMDARPVRAVLGHSFGGKVALALIEKRRMEELFVIDSFPGARPGREGSQGTLRVLGVLETLPAHFADRGAFRRYLRELGISAQLAAWLAQSLDRVEGGGYELGLDMDRIGALLDDYFVTDLWPLIDPPPDGTTAHLVIGGRSSVFSDADRERAYDVAARTERVHVHVLADADHWVHIDDPEGLHAIVAEALS